MNNEFKALKDSIFNIKDKGTKQDKLRLLEILAFEQQILNNEVEKC